MPPSAIVCYAHRLIQTIDTTTIVTHATLSPESFAQDKIFFCRRVCGLLHTRTYTQTHTDRMHNSLLSDCYSVIVYLIQFNSINKSMPLTIEPHLFLQTDRLLSRKLKCKQKTFGKLLLSHRMFRRLRIVIIDFWPFYSNDMRVRELVNSELCLFQWVKEIGLACSVHIQVVDKAKSDQRTVEIFEMKSNL